MSVTTYNCISTAPGALMILSSVHPWKQQASLQTRCNRQHSNRLAGVRAGCEQRPSYSAKWVQARCTRYMRRILHASPRAPPPWDTSMSVRRGAKLPGPHSRGTRPLSRFCDRYTVSRLLRLPLAPLRGPHGAAQRWVRELRCALPKTLDPHPCKESAFNSFVHKPIKKLGAS